MINLFYEESYWGHTNNMNGPKKVVTNLLASLEQEGIPYAVNVEQYERNLLLQYDWAGHVKHSELTLENCVIGPQIWLFDQHTNDLKENPHYYKSIIAPSQWVKDLFVGKFGYPEEKISIWPVGIELPEPKNGSAAERIPQEKKNFAVVGINTRNQFIYEDIEYTPEEFFQNFPKLIKEVEPEKIFLHADKQVMYEQIIELMTFLQSQGHGKIGLVFQEK